MCVFVSLLWITNDQWLTALSAPNFKAPLGFVWVKFRWEKKKLKAKQNDFILKEKVFLGEHFCPRK